MTSAAQALFTIDGDTATPDPIACGPWSPDTLHGGAVAALVAQVADGAADRYGGRLARLGLQLLRPVALVPLRVTTTIGREGRRVLTDRIEVHVDGELVAAATTLHIRPTALNAVAPAPPAPGLLAPAAGIEHHDACPWPSFNRDAIDLRHAPYTTGHADASAWTRLAVPVIAGRTTGAAARAAGAADLINGIGALLPADRYRCINADLTVHLERLPGGDWIALRARTILGTDGTGTAEAELFDRHGRIGRAAQALVIEAAPA